METTTLKNLISDNNPFGISGITIPRIQRAYAQGRNDAHAVKTRERFLGAIHDGLLGNGLTLDFIYGNVQNDKLIPLDGQQRLTTLWLLHWFADKKEKIGYSQLAKFSYNTRYSARDFLVKLADFTPGWVSSLSSEIQNQGWFPMDWANDPTVSGMLVMLDEIQCRFSDIPDLWEKLDKINFYFRNIEEMKLTDDIYIKMNSRGKPLTDFEHFKAEFLKIIRDLKIDNDISKRIGLKIDREWTDLLWNYRDADSLVDAGFLNLFRMISFVLIYKSDKSASEFNLNDEFGLLDSLFKDNVENVLFFEDALDSFVELRKEILNERKDVAYPLKDFFYDRLSAGGYEKDKVVVPQQISNLDIFEAVVDGAAMRKNTTYWVTMFYTFLIYVMDRDKVSDADFRRRLRIVVNLLKNSRNEVVDTPNGDAGNRMPAILRQVENIIFRGDIAQSVVIDGDVRQNFNVAQMLEEREKLIFTDANPQFADNLFRLEDYYLIEGRTDVVGYQNTDLYDRFITLFDRCNRDLIDCAMLSVCDYSQRLNYWYIQLGSANPGEKGNRAWHTLFHPTGTVSGFDNTKIALRTLLKKQPEPTDDMLQQEIDSYIQHCKKENLYDWRYYYLTYPEFRPACYGRFTMVDGKSYEMVALETPKRESSSSYQCVLMALMVNQAVADSAEWLGIRALSYKKGWLKCENDAFVSYTMKDDEERERFVIPQNENGIDTCDRIQYFKAHRRDETCWTSPVPRPNP